MAISADVSREEQVKGMFEQMLKAYGSIDIQRSGGRRFGAGRHEPQ